MNSYEVVTHSWDIGTTEHLDYPRFSEAIAAARKFLGLEEYAAVYDRKNKTAFVVFGNPMTPVFIPSVTVQEI